MPMQKTFLLTVKLSTTQGKNLLDDLASFGVPVILFSGGEPLTRKDLPELAALCRKKGYESGYLHKRDPDNP